MKKTVFTTAFLIFALLATGTYAGNLYIGAGIGESFVGAEVKDASDQIRQISENSTAWKIFGGYRLIPFLGIEGGYRSFGTVSTDISNSSFESKSDGWDVEAVGQIKLLMINVFGKAGTMFWSKDVTFLGEKRDDSGTDVLWGLGAGVQLGRLGGRVEWEMIAIGGPDDLSMVSLSATLGF